MPRSLRRLTVSLQGKQVGEVYTVTNEQSNLEKAVTSSLSNGLGEYTREDWLGYYTVQLRIAIEGILKHGR